MALHRLNHSFTSGELSPLMHERVDFDRYKNGCQTLLNAYSISQGPAFRRSGFEFVYDLSSLGLDTSNPEFRLVPFIFNESQAYMMIFFRGATQTHMALGYQGGIVVYDTLTECPPGTPVSVTPGDPIVLDMGSHWDLENFDWTQSADEVYFAQKDVAPMVIRRYSHECWVVETIVFNTTSPSAVPTEWGSGKWPEHIFFHQQRLGYAGNDTHRQTVWMTDAGDFLSFSANSPLLSSDKVSFTLDSGTQNKIQWVVSGKALFIGTLGDEWSVVGGSQTAITPSNLLSQRQTKNGSEPVKPLQVGTSVLFIEQHGRTVNEFTSEYNTEGYQTADLTILADHITADYSITNWTYQRTPNSIVWAVRSDGTLLGLTYQRQHKVIGWHRHTTDGEFKAVESIPGTTREDDVWVIVARELPSGTTGYYLEQMAVKFNSEEASDGRFLDSFLVYSGAATTSISGLSHLEGKTVDILINGMVHPSRTVSSGTVTLNAGFTGNIEVVIGLPFETRVAPNLPEIQDAYGTSVGRYQRLLGIHVNLYRSLGMKIGTVKKDGTEHEEEVGFRLPSDVKSEQVPLFTGWKSWPFPEGYSDEPNYYIKQDKPLPLVVRAVTDLIQVFEE